ncbi:MmgE/PrpD family protein [Amycolatopsis rhizosphaerae]|uniref:MmgE/PrpD family protein n=1 Tax=Amycolatopsis rhizosphaerae TaxID=2053003 RepID=A0A558BJX2_9PSEU|nr:MmgE/PrpD family protein [Amycolatopsis rhizosphaerae]
MLWALHEIGGHGTSTVAGSGNGFSLEHAALLNGTFAHSLDFDDTDIPGGLPPSAAIIPAALAVAEERDSSGADLLAAVALGYASRVRLHRDSLSLRSGATLSGGAFGESPAWNVASGFADPAKADVLEAASGLEAVTECSVESDVKGPQQPGERAPAGRGQYIAEQQRCGRDVGVRQVVADDPDALVDQITCRRHVEHREKRQQPPPGEVQVDEPNGDCDGNGQVLCPFEPDW